MLLADSRHPCRCSTTAPLRTFFALIKSSYLLQWHGHLGSRHAPSLLFSDFFNDFSACSLRTQPASLSVSFLLSVLLISLFSFYFSPPSLSLSLSLSLSFFLIVLFFHPYFPSALPLPICSVFVKIYVITISASRARISIHVRIGTRADAHQRAEMCSARKCMHEKIVFEKGTAVIPIRAKCACD